MVEVPGVDLWFVPVGGVVRTRHDHPSDARGVRIAEDLFGHIDVCTLVEIRLNTAECDRPGRASVPEVDDRIAPCKEWAEGVVVGGFEVDDVDVADVRTVAASCSGIGQDEVVALRK